MKTYSRKRHIRYIWLFYITLILFLFLTHRLFKLQACEHEKYLKLADAQHIGKIDLNPLRGTIYDRNGVSLAFSISLPSIAANPSQISNHERTAFYLSLALGKKREEILKALSTRSTFVWVERKVDPIVAEKIQNLDLPGIFIIEEPTGKRFHPKTKIAPHVLGYTGIDDQGLDGVEVYYDKILSGKPGSLEAEMDQIGRMIPGGNLTYNPPVPGKDLYLTIDETVQYIVEKELAAVVKEYRAAGGSIIVYDPKTGDIIALANYPDYSPENIGKIPKINMRNKAVCDAYEPGSTFKVILAATALDSGKATTTDQFYCGQSIEVGGYSLRNADDGLSSPTGQETIEGIITYSFNVGAASLGLKVGTKVFYSYIDRLGFGKLTEIDLPGETKGMVIPGSEWQPINLATVSYGQGIAVTPIQMVQAIGALANEGVVMKPRVVWKIADHEKGTYQMIPPVQVARVFQPKTCHEMLKILTNVCENGTAKKAKIPGYIVGGKTGTANVVQNGVYVSGKYIASFVGVVPVDDPKLVIMIKVDEPKGVIWGGAVAAPVFNKVGSQILWRLGIQPSFPEEIEMANQKEKTKDGELNN